MSKVIRRLRNIKIKSRRKSKADSKIIEPSYPRSNGIQEMKCVKLIHQRGKGCPLAEMNSNDKVFHVIATEGMSVGKIYTMGNEKKSNPGNILKLKNVPEGSYVHSLEYVFNDGGKVAMTAGSKCTIENHRREENETVIKLPSGVKRVFSSEVRCIVGVCASAGIKDKPLLKAGVAHHLRKSRGQRFPIVRAVAMNPVDHAHGGGSHQHIGTSSCISKRAPEAQKVGLVGARRTGYQK